jgi:hypothetical protein
MDNQTAILSSQGEYTTFSFNGRTITFLTSKNLDRYTQIKEWDRGYIVVMCRTKSSPETEREDYIDLVPILENLYIDPNRFLKPIKEVSICYV